MLKNILKSCITAAAVIAMAAPAMAADEPTVTVNGDIVEYFGQYTNGAEGEVAHFQNVGEAHLKLNATIGKVKVYYEIESRDGGLDAPATSQAFNAAQRKISYVSPIGLVSIGTITNYAGVPLAYGGGAKTSSMAPAPWWDLYYAGYVEADGIDLAIPVGEHLFQVSYWDSAAVAVAGANKAGTTMALSATIQAGPAKVRLGQTSQIRNTDNNWNGDDVGGSDTLSDTFMQAGVLVPFGNMGIAFTYAIGTQAVSSSVNQTNTVMNLQFNMNEAGPGNLIVSYESKAWAVDSTDFSAVAEMGLSYDIPLATGCGVQIVYYSEATTATDDAVTAAMAASNKTITKTYMGAGLYAKF
ncbi:hypothetical protein KKA14_15870 [bacterium]|nr:hypothetical protein [bacterium]